MTNVVMEQTVDTIPTGQKLAGLRVKPVKINSYQSVYYIQRKTADAVSQMSSDDEVEIVQP